MKKIVILVILCIAALLALPLSNLVLGTPKAALGAMESSDARLAEASAIFGAKCASCHVPGAALPWYASLPGASGIIQMDVDAGTRAVDLAEAFALENAGPVNEAVLAKLEHTTLNGLMPPARFTALHWDCTLGADDEAAIMDWVHAVRAGHFAVDGVADAFADGPLQPLPRSIDVDPAKVALGDKLYHDKRLSGDDSLSCASCHGIDKGGCDREAVSTGIDGQKGPINAPTVFNSVFQCAMFWDGRMADLKEQAGGPVENPIEMGASWEDVLPKLAADEALMEAFHAVYPELNDANVRDAIAEFEKSLLTPDSDFDKYLRGDSEALGAQARQGYELFVEHGCCTCHTGKILGGQSFEHMGYRADYFGDLDREITEADAGRFNHTGNEADRGKFKVPTLLNIALTYPYFHDAATSDLKEAAAIMAEYNTGATLSDAELDALTAFLNSLTGEYQGQKLQ